ncbi:MAG: hypothetical protein C5B50_13645 [Verrucomicrobia bacterium]|nr:MAG: hypothetical protein C5B50_13645 [Verrucomicrobiota bacterium]
MYEAVPCKRVLVYVDDSPDDQFFFEYVARKTETLLLIQPFFSVGPALDYLQQQLPFDDDGTDSRPCFLLCDYDLGPGKGHEAVAAIRSLGPCGALPIIMFSGSDGDDSVARSYQAGADYFLCKPRNAARLEIVVQTLNACAMASPSNFGALTSLAEYQPRPAKSGAASSRAAPGRSPEQATSAKLQSRSMEIVRLQNNLTARSRKLASAVRKMQSRLLPGD